MCVCGRTHKQNRDVETKSQSQSQSQSPSLCPCPCPCPCLRPCQCLCAPAPPTSPTPLVPGPRVQGLSFIYTLLALPYIHFSNIVLISRDGVPDHPNVSDHTWFADTLSFLEREYMLFRLPCKVRIIEGVVGAGSALGSPKDTCKPEVIAGQRGGGGLKAVGNG